MKQIKIISEERHSQLEHKVNAALKDFSIGTASTIDFIKEEEFLTAIITYEEVQA